MDSAWRKIAPVVFLFSIALNLAFVGIWGARTLQGEPDATLPAGGKGPQNCSQGCRLHGPIEMTEAQARELEPLLEEFARERGRLCVGMDQARGELIDAMASDEPDLDRVRRMQDEIVDVQRRMQDLTVRQILKEKEVLTPEQQEELFKYLRNCCRCSAGEGEEPQQGGCCGGS